MQKKRYFGTDGIRGRVGQSPILPQFMLQLGWAAGRILADGKRPIVIGQDTRLSGDMLASALASGLHAAGVDTLRLGVMPTPGVAHLARTLQAAAGIVISASHNPFFDNGVKFFSSQGDKLPDALELAIEDKLDDALDICEPGRLGCSRLLQDAASRYVEFCKSSLHKHDDLSGLRIVLDCAHGATSRVAPQVFMELGADVMLIGAQPDGCNINAGYGSTQPARLQQEVMAQNADLGIAFDGDGDRLVMVDGQGRLVDGDAILYILARARQQQGQALKQVVGTVMSNLGLEVALRELGIELARTPVGDRHVLACLRDSDAILGGEPSGHIICRDRSTTGDGIIAALQVLEAMQITGARLEDLYAGMVRFPQRLINVPLGQLSAEFVLKHPKVQQAKHEAMTALGLNGRVLLRASGTEPLIRVMVEGEDEAQVGYWAEHIATCIQALSDA